MGRTGSALLDTNDMFPEVTLQLVSGESLKIPGGAGGGYKVVLFYRGHW
jgi:hypothetical protein